MAEQAKAPAKPPKDYSKLLISLFMVLNILVMGGGGAAVFLFSMGWEHPKLTEEKLFEELRRVPASDPQNPLIYTMEKFTINLDGEPRRTIRMEINLEMLNDEAFEEVMNIESRAKARDAILRLMNKKSFSELEPLQGKLFLKDEIIKEMNGILSNGVVRNVYFSDFVVQ